MIIQRRAVVRDGDSKTASACSIDCIAQPRRHHQQHCSSAASEFVWRQDKPISFCTGVRATNCVASPLSLLSNSPVAVELSARHFHFRSSPTMHLGLTRSQPQPRSTDRHCFVVAACFCGSSCAVDG